MKGVRGWRAAKRGCSQGCGCERGVDRQGEEVAEDDGRDEGGPDGLRGLEHVRERDRTETEGDDTSHVGACEEEAMVSMALVSADIVSV